MYYCIESIKNLNNLPNKRIKSYKYQAINKIKNLDSKNRSILGEYLLIDGLYKYYNINYDDIDIQLNNYGKPFISNDKYSYVKYNISHSFDYVICAFSDKDIGVDIEKIRNVNIKIIKHFATINEIKYILSNKEVLLNL